MPYDLLSLHHANQLIDMLGVLKSNHKKREMRQHLLYASEIMALQVL